ncbi:hypothetical protein BESB_006480 [Besnoitia besnoiti]|uniref:Transmembrane protein n=1 Tax=Besnoitia besnoiti TaxID=94643 RepID=A0A2A9MQ68_BESBE|nr:hypothetical protein BESB_006480 [Besnoitia besnoiti]PFH38307.1 hypothetical protein BESB_006480 [Besnoitia besnoiti]
MMDCASSGPLDRVGDESRLGKELSHQDEFLLDTEGNAFADDLAVFPSSRAFQQTRNSGGLLHSFVAHPPTSYSEFLAFQEEDCEIPSFSASLCVAEESPSALAASAHALQRGAQGDPTLGAPSPQASSVFPSQASGDDRRAGEPHMQGGKSHACPGNAWLLGGDGKASLLDPHAPVQVITGYENFASFAQTRSSLTPGVAGESSEAVDGECLAQARAARRLAAEHDSEAENEFRDQTDRKQRDFFAAAAQGFDSDAADARRSHEELVDIGFSEDALYGGSPRESPSRGEDGGGTQRGLHKSEGGGWGAAGAPSSTELAGGGGSAADDETRGVFSHSPFGESSRTRYSGGDAREDGEGILSAPDAGVFSGRTRNASSSDDRASPGCTYTSAGEPATSTSPASERVAAASRHSEQDNEALSDDEQTAFAARGREFSLKAYASSFSTCATSDAGSDASLAFGNASSALLEKSRAFGDEGARSPLGFSAATSGRVGGCGSFWPAFASPFVSSSLIHWREMLKIVANRLYYSRFTAYLYLFVFLVNAWVLVRCLTLSVVDFWVVAAEIFVTIMLVVEVCLRALVVGRPFFFKFENIFDIAVTGLCVALLCVSDDIWGTIAGRERPPPEEIDDIFRQSLTAFRFSTQLLRMVTIALHQKRSKLPTDDIDFSYLEAQTRVPYDDGL